MEILIYILIATGSLLPIAHAADGPLKDAIINLEIQIRQDVMLINGSATDNSVIAECMKRLDASDFFDRVELREIRSQDGRKTFKIKCRIHSKDSVELEGGQQPLTDEEFVEKARDIIIGVD